MDNCEPDYCLSTFKDEMSIAALQIQDPVTSEIFEEMETKHPKLMESLAIQSDDIFYHITSPVRGDQKTRLQSVIQKVFNGHQGLDITYNRIRYFLKKTYVKPWLYSQMLSV